MNCSNSKMDKKGQGMQINRLYCMLIYKETATAPVKPWLILPILLYIPHDDHFPPLAAAFATFPAWCFANTSSILVAAFLSASSFKCV